ncbi:MAG: spore coat protein CotJB [Peptococcaceae bacterium]|nr:spore coat protein CotJB [Peptococcaceae bacterium]
MRKIRSLDFAIQEFALFLDMNPCNQAAMSKYNRLAFLRRRAVQAYEYRFGPLTIYGNTDANNWDWVKGPWPWEMED